MRQPKRNRESQVEKLSNYVDVDIGRKREERMGPQKSNAQRNCLNSKGTRLDYDDI